jgi:hypothetical protein
MIRVRIADGFHSGLQKRRDIGRDRRHARSTANVSPATTRGHLSSAAEARGQDLERDLAVEPLIASPNRGNSRDARNQGAASRLRTRMV